MIKKSVFFVISFLCSLLYGFGQSKIYELTFENTGGYTTIPAEFTDGARDYFTRTDGSNITGENFSNIQNNYYFAAQDTDDEPPNLSTTSLLIDDINTTGINNLQLRLFIAEDDNGSINQDWDANTYMYIEYDIDNSGVFSKFFQVAASGGTNTEPRIDTNLDGIGDGAPITNEFNQYLASIASSGNLLDIRITFENLDANDEDIAIDNIEIWGESSCSSLLSDDFSSGLTLWQNTGDWTISSGELKHNLLGVAGDSYIYSDLSYLNLNSGNYEWSFCLRNGNWPISSANNFTYYLITDSSAYTDFSSVNGYAIGVSRSGTTQNSELVLYSVSNGGHNIIRSTSFNWGNNDDICVRVIRNTSGLWELFYNPNGTGEISAGTVTNNDHHIGQYTGAFYEFSSSRAGLFWIDDINICRELTVIGPELQIVADEIYENCGYELDFGNVESNGAYLDLSFDIENLGSSNLDITSLSLGGANVSDFSIISPIIAPTVNVLPGNSQEINIRFTPSSNGSKSASITINTTDSDENPCLINLIGNGVTNSGNGPLMISQYYEGNGLNKWIEITNISNGNVNASNYFLAAYNQYNHCFREHLYGDPTNSIQLPNINMAPGDVILLNESSTTIPSYAVADANLFNASFSGDDIIVISTTDDEDCFKNRIDIIGEYSNPCNSIFWGQQKSFVRNQCVSQGTDITFDTSHWISYDHDDIEIATSTSDGTNPYLGQHAYSVTYNGFGPYNGWEGGFPTEYRHAIVDGVLNATTTSNIDACNLTVLTSGSLNVQNNSYVRVVNDVINNGTLMVQTEGAFVQDGIGSAAGDFENFGSGTSFVVKHTSTFNSNSGSVFYTYWSSPVSDPGSVESVFPNAFGNRRFYFEASNFIDSFVETNNDNGTTPGQDNIDDDGNDWQWANGGGVLMETGRGYAVTAAYPPPMSGNFNDISTFTGQFNTGDISVTIYKNNNEINDNNWNFIGNPYPSAISAQDFIDYNTDIDGNPSGLGGALFFWSQSSTPDASNNGNEEINFNQSDYTIMNGVSGISGGATMSPPSPYIPSGQGFFVTYEEDLSIAENTTDDALVWFTNDMRVIDNNDQFFGPNETIDRSNESVDVDNKLWINLTSNNGVFSQISVAYVENATHDFDGWYYDSPRSFSTSPYATIFTLIDNDEDKYAIQGRNIQLLNFDEVINLGFYTGISTATIYNFSLTQFEGNFLTENDIYVRDFYSNKVHNLKESDYSFTSEVGEFNDRFEIIFTLDPLSTGEFSLNNKMLSIIELQNGDVKFKLNSSHKMKHIELFDLLGRSLYSLNAGNNSEKVFAFPNLSQATYLAKVTLDNDYSIIKKAIKRK